MFKALYERTRILEEQRLVMENDLKNLGRMELLQVLLRVTESNEALMAENAELKSASSMQISRSAKVGSIAEAALQANGFFEAAQRSADDYLREIKKLRDEMVERSRAQESRQAYRNVSEEEQLEQSQLFERIQDQAKTYIQDVQTYADNVMARANSQAQGIIDDARLRSDEIIAQANSQARVIIEEAEARVAQKEPLKADGSTVEGLADIGFAEEESSAEVPTAESADAGMTEDLVSEDPSMSAAAYVEQLEGTIPGEDPSIEDSGMEKRSPEEPPVQELLAEELPIEDAPAEEAPIDAEMLNEPPTEESADEEIPAEEPQTPASQVTAPLNIDVIVSDIAAAAFTEEGLDPSSTGALVRRGRHVKLPEGMAI